MKARITLLVGALLAVCAYAANVWKAAEETPTAAGTVLIDDDLLTAKTVYETTLKTTNVTIAGEEFTHFIQVRNAANPSADEPNGTENAGSTSIVLNVKKDVTLNFFYRRQPTSQEGVEGNVYLSNDGKDLKLFSQDNFSVLDGELSVDHETEEQKYAFVKKTYQLAAGSNYTVSARGTTIQLFGITYEGVETVPTIGPAIVLDIESGKDISAELATALESNPMPESIAINLAANGSYTVGETINTAAPLAIVGGPIAPAVIDASALSAPLAAISTTPYESTLDENGFYVVGDISFCNVFVKGLKQQLIYGNKVKALVGNLILDNSVVEVAGGSKTVFDFNSGGVVGKLTISNSTIYGNPQSSGQLYSSQSGQKATEAGLESQKFSLLNSTFYNIAYDKNVTSHCQSNQKWLEYEVKNCLVLDCGKSGQFIKGLNGGQSGANPVWDIVGNSFQRMVDGALTDISANEETGDADEPVKGNVEGVVVFAGEYATGDLTLGNCPQNTAKVGDPRWLIDIPNDIANYVISAEATTINLGETAIQPVLVANNGEIDGMQFDFTLPAGVTVAADMVGGFVVTTTDRSNKLTATCAKIADNTYRAILLSIDRAIVAAGEGAVLNIHLQCADDATGGDYDIAFTNVSVSRVEGDKSVNVKVADFTAPLTIVEISKIPGDVDGNFTVDVTDVMIIVDYILNRPCNKFNFANADLDGDGIVNVTDAMNVVNIILHKSNARISPTAMLLARDLLRLGTSETGCQLHTAFDAPTVTALQMEVTLPKGCCLNNVFLIGKAARSHMVKAYQQSDRTYNVVVFSIKGSALDTDAPFLQLDLEGNGGLVEIENILCTDTNHESFASSKLSTEVTGITTVATDDNSSDTPIYNLSGQRLAKPHKGINITNGKKVVVK